MKRIAHKTGAVCIECATGERVYVLDTDTGVDAGTLNVGLSGDRYGRVSMTPDEAEAVARELIAAAGRARLRQSGGSDAP